MTGCTVFACATLTATELELALAVEIVSRAVELVFSVGFVVVCALFEV